MSKSDKQKKYVYDAVEFGEDRKLTIVALRQQLEDGSYLLTFGHSIKNPADKHLKDNPELSAEIARGRAEKNPVFVTVIYSKVLSKSLVDKIAILVQNEIISRPFNYIKAIRSNAIREEKRRETEVGLGRLLSNGGDVESTRIRGDQVLT